MSIEKWKESVGVLAQPWALALDDLITRSSDLSYYHVRGNIAWETSTETASAEEGRWVHLWGSKELRAKERRLQKGKKLDKHRNARSAHDTGVHRITAWAVVRYQIHAHSIVQSSTNTSSDVSSLLLLHSRVYDWRNSVLASYAC
nr:hypothetical protein B0A51_01761 [Rachicladosporium sp. CCFEE 5018]